MVGAGQSGTVHLPIGVLLRVKIAQQKPQPEHVDQSLVQIFFRQVSSLQSLPHGGIHHVPAVQHHIGALAQDIPDRFGMILKGAVRRYILPKIAAVADSKNHAPLLFAKLRHFRIVNALYTVDQVVGRHQPHRAAFPDGRLKGLQIIFMLEPRRHIGIGGLPFVLIIVGIEMLQQRRGF